MSVSQLDREYSPSQWSKRFDHEKVLINYGALAIQVTEKCRSTIPHILDISYGSTERTTYDVYGTHLPKGAPVTIFIHGGYWMLGDKTSTFPVPALVANGVKVIMIGYDLCPKVTVKDIVGEVKAATEQVLKSEHVSGSRSVWIMGHSVGAHMAASLLEDKAWIDRAKEQGFFQLIKGFALLAGIYNIEPLLRTSYNDTLKLSDEEIASFSFADNSSKGRHVVRGIKVIVATCECDSPVFIQESRQYTKRLLTLVKDVQYMCLRDQIDHFNILENMADENFVLTKVLLRHATSG